MKHYISLCIMKNASCTGVAMGTCVGGFVGVVFLRAQEWVCFLCLFVQISIVCMSRLVGGWGCAHILSYVYMRTCIPLCAFV